MTKKNFLNCLLTNSHLIIKYPKLIYFFFLNDPAPTEIYPLPLHAPLPILAFIIVTTAPAVVAGVAIALLVTGTTLNIQSFMGAIMAIGVATANAILLVTFAERNRRGGRSEEHTSELQSQSNLVCRLLLEKK